MNIRDYRNVMEQLSPTPELEGRIKEGLAHPPRRQAHPRWLAGKVLAAAIAIACTFMVAMAVSPQLRAAMLTLFHLEETEQVPGPDRDRPDQPELTQDTIDQQVDVQYIHLPVSGSGLDYGTGVVYQPKQAADGTLLAVSFWAVEGDALVPLETRTTDFSMDWQGGTYSDTVFWCEYNGTVACCRSGSTGTSSGALCLVSGIPGRTDAVFFSLSQNTEAGYSVSTSRLLDLTTGQVTDLLAGSQWEQASSPVYLDWNPTFSAAVLTPDWKEWVYWDRTGKATTSLTELTGLNILCAYFSPDGTLILLARSDTDPPLCDVWTYEPRSGTLTRTFSHLPRYGWESETHGFLFFAGLLHGIHNGPDLELHHIPGNFREQKGHSLRHGPVHHHHGQGHITEQAGIHPFHRDFKNGQQLAVKPELPLLEGPVMLRGKAAEDRLLLLNGKHRHIFLPAIAAAAQKPFHPLPPAERRVLHQALGIVQQPRLLVAERLQHQLFLGGKEGIEKGFGEAHLTAQAVHAGVDQAVLGNAPQHGGQKGLPDFFPLLSGIGFARHGFTSPYQ